MNHTKNAILHSDFVQDWISENLTANTKNTLYFDANKATDPIVEHIFDSASLLNRLQLVIVNGNPPGSLVEKASKSGGPSLMVINKTIETPLTVSLNVGKRSYLYRDQSGDVRTGTDDPDIGRVLDQIHTNFESLAW
jgi:hypothetical protein